MASTPRIDVVIVAYNANKYIGQAIESVISQNTIFPVNIHVYDDCSTDGTASVITSYLNTNRNIYLHQNPVNQGTFRTLQTAIANCKAEFVALLEGDDYWNDANKLQMQVDFLLTNPKYPACAGNSLIYNQELQSFEGLYNQTIKPEYSLTELFSVPPFQIGTLVYRRQFLETLPDEFRNTVSNDKLVYTLLAKHGSIYCFNQVLAVYRKHKASISHSPDHAAIYEKHKLFYGIMRKYWGQKYHPVIGEAEYDHLKGYIIEQINRRMPIKHLMPSYFRYWLGLKKWTSMSGYKELYRIGRKIF